MNKEEIEYRNDLLKYLDNAKEISDFDLFKNPLDFIEVIDYESRYKKQENYKEKYLKVKDGYKITQEQNEWLSIILLQRGFLRLEPVTNYIFGNKYEFAFLNFYIKSA